MHSDFVFNLNLSIADPDALWQSAATVLAAASPSLSDEDIADTLGPREAPNLADCLTVLLLPSSLPGGTVRHFSCKPVTDGEGAPRNPAHVDRDPEGAGRPAVGAPVLARAVRG